MDAARDRVIIDNVLPECINENPEALARTYLYLKDEGLLNALYWAKGAPPIETFVVQHSTLDAPIYALKHEGDYLGWIILSDMVLPHKVDIGIAFRRRYWGDLPQTLTTNMLGYIHSGFGVERIYGCTPWRSTVSLAERCGLKVVGKLPGYASGRDVWVVLHTAEDGT